MDLLFLLGRMLKAARKRRNARLFRPSVDDPGSVFIGPEYDRNFVLIHPEGLRIGTGTAINGDCYINALGGVTIGRYCHIGRGLTVYSHNHNYKSESFVPYDDGVLLRPVTVGDAVWIGANVCLAPGATIGDGAIIGIGSVVYGAVPACAIAKGNPATVVGWRDKATFERLVAAERFH